MQRRKVWLLFTAVIIAVFAMVGCLPETTPDKTPPEITGQSATLSATQIAQGDPVTVTVSVTAKDKRSNLKEAVMKLFLKKPGETTFTQIATATEAFAATKEATKTHQFNVAGTNFQTVGNYTFKAEVTASDVKGNTSTAKEVQPSGVLSVQGTSPSKPSVAITYPSTSHYSEGKYTVVPEIFNLKVVGTDSDADLVELKVVLRSNTQTLVEETASATGTSSLTIARQGIAPDLGDNLEATMTLHVSAKDSNANVTSEDVDIVARKQDIAVIESLTSVRGSEESQLPKVSHYKIPPATSGDIVQVPEADRLSVPFGLSKMWVAFNDDDVNANDTIKAYVYTNSTDIFSGDEYAFRAEAKVNSEKRAYIEVPNFWRQADVDEAKWLVLSVFHNGGSTPVIRYVWNITARGDTANPIFDIVDSSSDFDEGVPLYFEAAATDELLEAITDLGLQVNIGQSGWEPLEDAINELNASVPAEENYQFALRYHVKIKMDLEDTTYASGLVDDGIDYMVSNAVTNHDDIRWFDIYHGKIPGMPESDQTQADYWWKTDGLSRIVGEDDDDSYYGGNTPDEEPYATNLPAYAELDHRSLDKRQYVYEFTDLDTTKVQKIKTEAFVEQVKFKVWIYPEVVRADKDDLASQIVKPDVIDVVDVAIGPGTWKDQHVDYRVVMEVADWRWGGINPDTGKAQETANFTVEEDELAPTIEISGYDASQQNAPFKHVFRDNEDLFTLSSDVKYSPGMFFIDDVEVFSGGEITIRAKDDIALNDLLVYFDSTESQINGETDTPRAPFIDRNAPYSHPLTGFDYKYSPEATVFTLIDGREEQGDARTTVLSEFDPGFVERRLRLFGSDFKVNGDVISPLFELDRDYEYYVNFTNDDVVNDAEIAAHNNTFGRTNDVYLGIPENSEYEQYSGEFSNTFRGYVSGENSVNQAKAEYTFQVPDVEGDYYAWIVARDRSAQDTKLFDYPANVNEDYFAEGSLGEYDPVVLKGYQNEIFGDVVNSNGNPNYDLQYYDDSMSEDDADMVVLLRIRVKPHSWDIMRLDIHEPDLVSYPTVDNEGNKIWYSDSYSPWQVPEEFNDSDLKVEQTRLPRDMYPVYKYYDMYKEGYRGVYTNGKIDPFGYQEGDNYNAYGVTEVNAPGTGKDPLREFVPIVGGNNGTEFRVRTHEDLTRVTLYLVEGEYWYNEEMEQAYGNLDTNPNVIAKINMNANDNDKKWGFWEWNIADWANVNGHNLMGQEATYTLAVRAYHSTVTDPRVFYEQFQWPFFLDTKGPEIEMYNVNNEVSGDFDYASKTSYLNIEDMIEKGRTESDIAYPVGDIVAMIARDGGALYFEENKNIRDVDNTPPLSPISTVDVPPAGTWKSTMEFIRAEDVKLNHKVMIKAGDTTTYEQYWKQNLLDFSGSWRMGFPGTGTEAPAATAQGVLNNSLKYLNADTGTIDYLGRNTVLNERYAAYMDNIYSDQLKKVFQGALPTVALFQNIDFDKYIWRDLGNPQQAFAVSLVDELNNEGTWSSYLRKKQDFAITAAATFNGAACRDDGFTLAVTANDPGITFDKVEIRELNPSGAPVAFDSTNPATSFEFPAANSHTFSNLKGILVPAYYATRTLNVVATNQSGDMAATEVMIPGVYYAGDLPELAIVPTNGSAVGDLYEDFRNAGKENLIPLLKPNERYYVKGFAKSSPATVKLDFESSDDNVDYYYTSKDATLLTAAQKGAINLMTSGASRTITSGSDVDIDFMTIPGTAEYGHIFASLAAKDCAGTSDWNATQTLDVWYQNEDTFVQSVSATPASGEATGIEVVLQSDILFSGVQELKDNFEFSKNGVVLEIVNVYTWDAINNVYKPVATQGRNSKFLFEVQPFFAGASARGYTGLGENGLTYSMSDLIGVGMGNIEESNVGKTPEVPVLESPTNGATDVSRLPTFSWTIQGSNSVSSALYLEEAGKTTGLLCIQLGSGLKSYTLPEDRKLVPNKTYTWFVTANNTQSSSSISSSERRTFTVANAAPTVPSSPSPMTGATEQPLALTLDWAGSVDPEEYGISYTVQFSKNFNDVVNNQATATTAITASQYMVSGLTEGTMYYWKVVAKDAQGAESSSGIWAFTTVMPKNLVYVSPTNGEMGVQATDPLTVNATVTGTGTVTFSATTAGPMSSRVVFPAIPLTAGATTVQFTGWTFATLTEFTWNAMLEDSAALAPISGGNYTFKTATTDGDRQSVVEQVFRNLATESFVEDNPAYAGTTGTATITDTSATVGDVWNNMKATLVANEAKVVPIVLDSSWAGLAGTYKTIAAFDTKLRYELGQNLETRLSVYLHTSGDTGTLNLNLQGQNYTFNFIAQ